MVPAAQKYFDSPKFLRIALPAVLTVVILPALEKSFTESAWSILVTHDELHRSGQLTLAEVRQRAIHQVERLRYGPKRKDYFAIFDMHPNMIMHPYRTDLNGQDVSDFQDPNGKKLFVEFVRTVQENNAGYVEYMWQWKDDATNIVPRIGYVKGFEPWGWIIGSGIYINNVQEELAQIRGKLSMVSVFILVIVPFGGLYYPSDHPG